jgi:uncharacterized membrane protein YdbT with pleckstrin-like domain
MEEASTEILQQSRHHVTNSGALLIARLVIGLFLVETSYAFLLFIAASEPLENYQTVAINLLWVAQTLKFLVELGVVLAVVIPWAATNYYLTDRQLIRYVGIHRRDETIFDLATLKSIELNQGWFGRILNYGDLSLTFSSSGYTEKTTLYGVYNPKKYERYLKETLGKLANPGQ